MERVLSCRGRTCLKLALIVVARCRGAALTDSQITSVQAYVIAYARCKGQSTAPTPNETYIGVRPTR